MLIPEPDWNITAGRDRRAGSSLLSVKGTLCLEVKNQQHTAKLWPAFGALALGVKINANLFPFNRGLCGEHVQVKSTECLSEFAVEIRTI